MVIPNEYIICDKRTFKDFAKETFCNYKLNDVLSIFEKKMKECKIEEACNWAIELLISGHINKFWDKIFGLFVKYININNPQLPNIIYNRYAKFIIILKNTDNNTILIRNNQECRNLIVEVTFIICNSLKTKTIGFVTIKENDYNLNLLQSRFISTNKDLVNDKIKYGDPEETKIILNEFNYCLIHKKYELCVYWLSWILNWEKINTKKNKNYICGYREISNVESKYYTELVWLIWEIIIKETSKLNNENINLSILSLFKLYKYDFKPGKKAKNNYYILYAIKYFTDSYIFNQKINNYHLLVQVCSNINFVFFDKNKYAINNNKQIEKKMYINQKNNIQNNLENDAKKIEIKKLKQKAEDKMKLKISRVEEIDKIMMNK